MVPTGTTVVGMVTLSPGPVRSKVKMVGLYGLSFTRVCIHTDATESDFDIY